MRKVLMGLTVLALAACGDDDDEGAAASAEPAVEATTTTTVDEMATFCGRWDQVRTSVQSDDPAALDDLEAVANAGLVVDNPTISDASQDIVEALTWAEQDPLPPPPDPQAMTDAILAIGFECDPITGG